MPANRSRAQSLKTTCGSARWAELSEWGRRNWRRPCSGIKRRSARPESASAALRSMRRGSCSPGGWPSTPRHPKCSGAPACWHSPVASRPRSSPSGEPPGGTEPGVSRLRAAPAGRTCRMCGTLPCWRSAASCLVASMIAISVTTVRSTFSPSHRRARVRASARSYRRC
jgi:hypothetical protein